MSPDEIEVLLSGCARVWDLNAQVERQCDGSVSVLTEQARAIVARSNAADRSNWWLTIERAGSEGVNRSAYQSVLPMLRDLRALLAPDLPPSRLIIAPSPDTAP